MFQLRIALLNFHKAGWRKIQRHRRSQPTQEGRRNGASSLLCDDLVSSGWHIYWLTKFARFDIPHGSVFTSRTRPPGQCGCSTCSPRPRRTCGTSQTAQFVKDGKIRNIVFVRPDEGPSTERLGTVQQGIWIAGTVWGVNLEVVVAALAARAAKRLQRVARHVFVRGHLAGLQAGEEFQWPIALGALRLPVAVQPREVASWAALAKLLTRRRPFQVSTVL